MATQNGTTTLACLFHTRENAEQADRELSELDLSPSAINRFGYPQASSESTAITDSQFKEWLIPDRDARILSDGLRSGGSVFIVQTTQEMEHKVDAIFKRHASKIDEKTIGESGTATTAAPLTGIVQDGGAIQVIAEDLTLGKREVESGGTRLHSRIVETPVQESVHLREEHVTVERHAVDRAVSGDAFASASAIEVMESAEVPVVSKTARVVEEISLGKQTTERVETVSDSVRHTEVEVEPLESSHK